MADELFGGIYPDGFPNSKQLRHAALGYAIEQAYLNSITSAPDFLTPGQAAIVKPKLFRDLSVSTAGVPDAFFLVLSDRDFDSDALPDPDMVFLGIIDVKTGEKVPFNRQMKAYFKNAKRQMSKSGYTAESRGGDAVLLYTLADTDISAVKKGAMRERINLLQGTISIRNVTYAIHEYTADHDLVNVSVENEIQVVFEKPRSVNISPLGRAQKFYSTIGLMPEFTEELNPMDGIQRQKEAAKKYGGRNDKSENP